MNAAPIKLIALDVDGTLTNGLIHYDSDGAEHKSFHVADGLGIVMAQAIGLRFAVITGRRSPLVERRMTDDLKVADVLQKCGDKAAALRGLMEKYDLHSDEIAYIGDDINDLPAFQVAGLKIAVADAAVIVRAQADYVTERPGGCGAVREAIDIILQAQGRYEEAVAAFLAQSKASGTVGQ